MRCFALGAFLTLCASLRAVQAIGQVSCVLFQSTSSAFSLASHGTAAPVIVSADDWPGVQRAASDFVEDIHRVTGVLPILSKINSSSSLSTPSLPVIVGTLGHSSLIDVIVDTTQLDVSGIVGQWEAFISQVVYNPLPGIESAYVIIGADKRGTIYALYDHSEQFGVSPWYWWADVPVTQHAELYVSPTGCSHGSPTVKYRGIFLNDEQPALQNWAMVKFTNGTGAALTGSPFNHYFYTSLFELMLRMKANYLWPAMWASAFAVDDSMNQFYADLYGIVMGTSHEEPMMRSIPVEWSLFGEGPWDYSTNSKFIYDFWVNSTIRAKPYENVFTVGMRGDGDLPLSSGDAIPLLEQAIKNQRTILSDVYNTSDVTTIPQMWCLYKEVEGYYEEGLTVPDDVTLLWTDDNYGNVRRYPVASEQNRTGGAGIYYHFDYVGEPRNFKWITTSQISKTYEQMSLAVDREATRIWILNVGDLKPYEMDIEFFITYGWDSSIWSYNNLNSFVTGWAEREFSLGSKQSADIADIISNVTRYNSRRKLESMNATVYSFTDYREADEMLAAWESLSDASTRIYNSLPSEKRAAFFQLVQHPVQASHTLNKMWIYAGTNNLRASQARYSSNSYADAVQQLFEQDYDLEEEYHTILEGKWYHMMDQTHVMYYYWQQPMTNTMPLITRMQTRKQNIAGVMRIVPEGSMGAWPGDDQYDCAQGYSCSNPTVTIDPYIPVGNRYVDVAAGGPLGFSWTVTSNASWLYASPSAGSIDTNHTETRVYVKVDWSQVNGNESAVLTFNATSPGQPALSVPVTFMANHTIAPNGFKGFVEGDGGVSIEAAHASRNSSDAGITWVEIPDYGRTLSGVTPWPRTGDDGGNFTAGTGPSIEYDFYNFNTIGDSGNVTVTTHVAPSLNANGDDRPLAFAIGVDDQTPQSDYYIPYAAPGDLPNGWDGMDGWVSNSIIPVTNNFTITPGSHTLKVWMIEPAVVLEKFIIDTGNVRASYLGPPESIYLS